MDRPKEWSNHDVQRYFDLARAEATKLVRNPKLAEEVAEKAFFQLETRVAVLRPPDDPAAWIRAVVQNHATKAFQRPEARTVQLHDVAPGDERDHLSTTSHAPPNSERWFMWRERLLAIEPRLVSRLTALQTKVLYHLLNGQTTREAARACGVQPSQVRRSRTAIIKTAEKILRNLPPLPPLIDGAAD